METNQTRIFRKYHKYVWPESKEDVRRIFASITPNVVIYGGVGYLDVDWTEEQRENVKLPNSLEIIPENAFRYCSNLECIELPNTLKTIKESAFSGCGFKNIEIPKGTTTIEKLAFHNNYNLLTTVIPNSINELGE